jgi:Uma2 family endonuclease
MAVSPARRRFTVDEYHRMADAGILGEDDRVELIDGEIVQMTPIGPRHAGTVMRVLRVLFEGVAGRASVAAQNPAVLDELSEPQPDVYVARTRNDDYTVGHPRPEDLLLVVEVSDSSLAFDRDVKIPHYAMTGVTETWIVDLVDDRVVAYRSPIGSAYADVQSFARGSAITPLTFPDLNLNVDDILPPN